MKIMRFGYGPKGYDIFIHPENEYERNYLKCMTITHEYNKDFGLIIHIKKEEKEKNETTKI